MANKKYYLVDKFETKEDFDKRYNSIYNAGYESGYEDGLVEAVSYMFELIDHFGYETQRNGERMNGDRKRKLAMRYMKAGTTQLISEDPAYREQMKEYNRRTKFNKLFKDVKKETDKMEF